MQFLSPAPSGDTYAVRLRLIGKRVMHFHNGTFSLGVTAEALRAFIAETDQFGPTILSVAKRGESALYMV